MDDPAAARALARVWFDDVINRRDLDAIDRTYAPEYAHHGNGGAVMDRRQARRFAEALLAASADRRATVHEQLVDGDVVITRWSSTGTHTGAFLGIPATGKEFTVRGIVMSRMAGGRIVEDWEYTDAPLALAHLRGSP